MSPSSPSRNEGSENNGKSVDRYRTLFEKSSDAILLGEPETDRILEANDQAADLLGYSRRELTEDVSLSSIYDPSQETYRSFVADVCDGADACTEELVCSTASGDSIPVSVTGSTVGVDGRDRVFLSLRNISEKREAYAKLENEKEKFESIFDITNDAIFIVDLETDEIVDCNPSAAELTGYSREQLRSMSPADIHPHEYAAFRDFTDDVSRDGTGWTDQLSCQTKSGEIVPSEISAATGQIDGHGCLIMSVRDISEQRRREREIERRNEQLESFASIISHDLRNPLNVATGHVNHALDTNELRHLQPAVDALERMDEMIDDLLQIAREGATADSLEPVDLSTFTERCWENVATSEAVLETETDLVIRADRDRLKHVFENLFRNAVEHSDTTPTVRVDELETDDGFYIADDGPGIPAADHDAVFEMGETTSSDGTGLGLAIVEQIARAHDWSVDVTESVDGGARFEFTGVDTSDLFRS